MSGHPQRALVAKSLDIKSIEKVIRDFRGDITELERAIGAYLVGQLYGLKPLMLVHNRNTLGKYEKILGIRFREHLPEVGSLATKLRAYRLALKMGSVWKAIRGDVSDVRGPTVDR